MLDKVNFNNMVMTYKNEIRQSRIQTINKLVRKLRSLKEKIEKPSPSVSCPDKAQKKITQILEAMHYIKHLKPVELMKNVLLLDKPPVSYITNVLCTSKELGVALLALNKIMSTLIHKFKLTLCLEDTVSATWKTELNQVCNKKRQLEYPKMNKMKAKRCKQDKLTEPSKKKLLKQINTDERVPISQDCEIQEISSDKILDSKKSKTNPFNKNNEENIKQIETLENDDVLEQDEFVVDTFFVTETGENYLSTAVQRNHNNSNNEKTENFPKSPLDAENERKKFKNPHHQKKIKGELPPTDKEASLTKNFKSKENALRNDNNGKSCNMKNVQNLGDKNLHPSWAAKQKLKPVITAFQGKKVVFADDE